MPNLADLTGQRFGRLKVLQRSITDGRAVRWDCRCDCGVERPITASALRRGATSCGCIRRERMATLRRKHGETRGSRTPEYDAWASMLRRCENPKNPRYPRYGGRGIRVCDRWHAYENFLADMGRRPSPKHTIDRINNDGNYEPGNVRWATYAQQNSNYSRNKPITFQGRTMVLPRWADEIGISKSGLRNRIKKWGVERALSTSAPNVAVSSTTTET